MTNDLLIFIYSYKNRDLQAAVDNVYESTHGNFSVVVVDQNTIDRKHVFNKYPNMTYRHVYWDFLYGPVSFKKEYLVNTDFENYLMISDNITLSKDWNLKLLKHYGDRMVISGNSSVEISQEGYFSITPNRVLTDEPVLTNYIDRNFIFYSRHAMEQSEFPAHLKYNGEEEELSIRLYNIGYDIYSATSHIYTQTSISSIGNVYVPYSLNHGYNTFINNLKNNTISNYQQENPRTVKDFCNFHKIDISKIYPLPFDDNDVQYDPNKLQIDLDKDAGNRRFVASLKGIF
jgi:hypothetical protein